MKLFTHQSKEFIVNLLENNIVYNNGTLMNDETHIKYVYEMITKYARENVSKEFISSPIWCWYKIESANENDGIKIELNVPDELVLLTDYYDWGGSVIPYADDYINYYNKSVESKIPMMKAFEDCINQEILRGDVQVIIPYIDINWVTNLIEIKEAITHVFTYSSTSI